SSQTVLRPRQRPQHLFFWARRQFKRVLQDLSFHRLLAEQTLQLAHLVLERAIFGRSHDFALGCRRRQRTLRGQLAPEEKLVWLNTVAPSDKAHRYIRRISLLDHRQFLSRRPSPSALWPVQDLNRR